eukprot:CAMPEP_0116828700 /NCGR_PEP_ID=MMETSP0418-20121206/3792_1 /TAXON_ID=1158023 /ORGANISM="Astrosyne radiata, Strain 13vi08-1A" /LENGTH=174 /DNA_ID=CAMNT_0004457599 /DNA_START=238 /DNA_END=762 /DNA_ORIENTATION=-
MDAWIFLPLLPCTNGDSNNFEGAAAHKVHGQFDSVIGGDGSFSLQDMIMGKGDTCLGIMISLDLKGTLRKDSAIGSITSFHGPQSESCRGIGPLVSVTAKGEQSDRFDPYVGPRGNVSQLVVPTSISIVGGDPSVHMNGTGFQIRMKVLDTRGRSRRTGNKGQYTGFLGGGGGR